MLPDMQCVGVTGWQQPGRSGPWRTAWAETTGGRLLPTAVQPLRHATLQNCGLNGFSSVKIHTRIAFLNYFLAATVLSPDPRPTIQPKITGIINLPDVSDGASHAIQGKHWAVLCEVRVHVHETTLTNEKWWIYIYIYYGLKHNICTSRQCRNINYIRAICFGRKTAIIRSMQNAYLLTHSMVQSPSWEANWFAASQEIPRISRNPKVHYRTHKRPPPVSILGQPNPVHIPTSHVLEIHLNIIHPSMPRSPQWSLSLQLPQQDPIHPPLLTHMRHMPSPYNDIDTCQNCFCMPLNYRLRDIKGF